MSALMPRYFFALHNDVEAVDDEGLELADIAAARVVALKTIAELIHDKIANGERVDLSHSLEVLDGDRRPLLLLPFREMVEG
jgi:hypothetical protein